MLALFDPSELTPDDVDLLVNDASWTNRAKVAEKIASLYVSERLAPEKRLIADAVFRILIRDSEVLVRRTIAESLKDYSKLARDIALVLATDVADVAAPILERSPVLTEDDIAAILRDHSTAHAAAVARRCNLSRRLSGILSRMPLADRPASDSGLPLGSAR